MKSSWWLLALVLGAVIPAAAGDWPQWRGPDRDGISRETGWRSDWGAEDRPKILWEAKVGIGFSSFAVSEGRVFTLGNDSDTDTLWCFEAATGKAARKHYMEMQKGDVPATWADNSLLRRLTGYRPETNIRDGMAEFVKWYRNYYRP